MKLTIMISIILVSTSVVVISGSQKAFGALNSDGTYFCDVANLDNEKYRFRDQINNFNDAYIGTTPKEVADDVLRNPGYHQNLDNLGKSFECLRDHGVDPNSVNKLSDNVINGYREAASQDPVAFYKAAPNFAENVFGMNENAVPEFPLAQTVILVSIIGSIVICKRFSNSIGNPHP